MSDESDPLAWETVDGTIAYSCPGFEVVRERVRLPDGTETDFDSVVDPAAVVVLGFTPHGEVVVIEEWRQAVKRVSRGLPAGTVEPGEDIEQAARREFEEETGYVAEGMERLTTVEPLNGLADSVHHHFVAHDCRPTGTRELDDNESIRVGTAEYDDLLRALADDDLRDGRSAFCLLYHTRFGTESGVP
ncbi:NUDIX hydrolase [Halococcus sp. AFM35]|uniref:NUDIX hydrolase n=1 Tax=Halococcus sp. AFM35 TaxID=3421653 RepID=UPI003EB76FB7